MHQVEPCAEPCGVLLIDKPAGMTSHDVVARVRRLLRTRHVGHAGTLDPSATGLLAMVVGEATKLVPYLTASIKRYRAVVLLGQATHSLDADGELIAEAPLSELLRKELITTGLDDTHTQGQLLASAFAFERERQHQVPPAVSAIHVDGIRAHERVRRGEEVAITARPVRVHTLALLGVHAAEERHPRLAIEMEVSAGYYVRSFARDLGAALDVPAHLSALRRLASGSFDVHQAIVLPPDHDRNPPSEDLLRAILPLESVLSRVLPCIELSAEGAQRARFGQKLTRADFSQEPPAQGVQGWLFQGKAIAIGEFTSEAGRVLRGFSSLRRQGGCCGCGKGETQEGDPVSDRFGHDGALRFIKQPKEQ